LERIENIYIPLYIINIIYNKFLSMSKKLEAIAKILGITLSSETEIKLAEAITAEGVKVYTEAETFEVGAAVTVVDENDIMQPASQGEYVLEDGSTIVLDEAGIIIEVKPKVEETEDPAEAELSDDEQNKEVKAAITPEEQTAIVTEVMQIIEPRLAALEEALLKAVEALSGTNKDLTEKVEKLSAQPAVEPLKPKYSVPVSEENALARYKRK
jgi:hypothetical protein